MCKTHVTVGANVDFDDYLAREPKGGPAGNWPVPKSAEIDDYVVILLPSIHGDFRAFGRVAGEPQLGEWGKRRQYFVPVKGLVRIEPRVPIALIHQGIPNWAWAGYARSFTSVPAEFVDAFWALLTHPPMGYDNEQPPERVQSVVSRIVRDTAAANSLKRKYDFKCQVCGIFLPYGDGQRYIEVHHLRPLGQPHDGPDATSNMLVLCPNHHALFDLAAPRFIDARTIEVDGKRYELTLNHVLARANIDYYSRRIREG